MQKNIRELVIAAMLAALAFVSMLFIRFTMFADFLSYDPKDVIIIIGGFLFGPVTAICVIVVVSLVEMVTISTTGFWGLIMNIISSMSFVLPAVMIYRWKRSLAGAVIGLFIGIITVTGVMLLWNYLIVPLYMPFVTRADVVGMLATIFLSFNLVKSALNAAIVMLLYKPVSVALQQARLYQPSEAAARGKFNIWVLIISAFVILTLILIILADRGVF